jgi:hypothetical protein
MQAFEGRAEDVPAGAAGGLMRLRGLAPHVRQMTGDYGTERDRLRACK